VGDSENSLTPTPEAAPGEATEPQAETPQESAAPEPTAVSIGSGPFYGTGRRKTSIARVYLRPGSGRLVDEVLAEDLANLRSFYALEGYRAQGTRIAVDDAGAGYASFTLIAALRPSIIKIDRDIVHGLWRDDAKQALVEAFVSFGRRIGAQIVGETSTVVGGTGTTQSTCSTVKGACSVKLVSSEYRPRVDSEPSGLATANRVTVTAYALGEESFVDADGNNVFDQGESWDDLGDIFVDNDEDTAWELGEQSIQYSANNTSDCPAALPANGKLDNAASRPGTCDAVWGQAHVRRSMVIVLSGNHAQTDTPGHVLNMAGIDAQ